MATDPQDDDTPQDDNSGDAQNGGDSGSGSDQDGPKSPPNPFAGTPLEQQMSAVFGTGGQMPDLNQLMSQVQQMFEPMDGPVNWDLTTTVARKSVAKEPDPSTTTADAGAISDAVRLAELWLDQVTDIPAGANTSAAWSRAEWVEQTRPTWERLIEPIAEHVVAGMSEVMPEEMKPMLGPLVEMMSRAGALAFGAQVGEALGDLAKEVVTTTDIGLPLGPDRVAALLPSNLKAFGEGLDLEHRDVVLYFALREVAHHRLFHHAPWLRPRLISAIEEFGRGTKIDMSQIEQAVSELDMSNPQSLQQAFSSGLYDLTRTPEQDAALERIELLLALIEGWVDEVVTQATQDRMPAAVSMREAVRRRRAAGGPAEQTFASLVGLELRPRRLRDAAGLWGALRDRQGASARDAVWAHPDLLPTISDLDDPLGFGDEESEESQLRSEEFDAALADLLGENDEDTDTDPDADTDPER